MLQVDEYETDVLGLKEEMKVSLQTAMNTGTFKRALDDAFFVQKNTIEFHPGERVESFFLKDMNIYNDEFKIATIESVLPPKISDEHAYYPFLYGDTDETYYESHTIIEHRFTHVYVALTVFALTLACLFLSYGCFMSRACRRIRQRKASNGNDNPSSSEGGKGNRHHSHGHQLEVEEVLDDIVAEELEEEGRVSVNDYSQTETIAF